MFTGHYSTIVMQNEFYHVCSSVELFENILLKSINFLDWKHLWIQLWKNVFGSLAAIIVLQFGDW